MILSCVFREVFTLLGDRFDVPAAGENCGVIPSLLGKGVLMAPRGDILAFSSTAVDFLGDGVARRMVPAWAVGASLIVMSPGALKLQPRLPALAGLLSRLMGVACLPPGLLCVRGDFEYTPILAISRRSSSCKFLWKKKITC